MNLKGPFDFKYLGRKTKANELLPYIVSENQQVKAEKPPKKFQCHFCSNYKSDKKFQCSNCTSAFCSFCVEALTANKDKLNALCISANEQAQWKCFKCTKECPCQKCSKSKPKSPDHPMPVIQPNKPFCEVCKEGKNLARAEYLVKMINQNDKIKKEIIEYERFAPLFQRNTQEKLFLCERCHNKLEPLFVFYAKEEYGHFLSRNTNKPHYPLTDPHSLNHKDHKDSAASIEKQKFRTREMLPMPFIKKDIEEASINPLPHKTEPIVEVKPIGNSSINNKVEERKDNKDNKANSNNHNINNVNKIDYSQNRIVYQPIIPFIQFVPPPYHPPLYPPFLFNKPLPFPFPQPAAALFNNKMQRKLYLILYQSISFFFNNCIQSQVSMNENIKVLLNQITSQSEDCLNSEADTSSLRFYLSQIEEEISRHLDLLNTSQAKLNESAVPFLLKSELQKNITEIPDDKELNGSNEAIRSSEHSQAQSSTESLLIAKQKVGKAHKVNAEDTVEKKMTVTNRAE